MNLVQGIQQGAKNIFSQKVYLFVAVLASIFFFFLSSIVNNYFSFGSVSFTLLFEHISTLLSFLLPFASSIIILNSLLGGLLASASLFLILRQIRAGFVSGTTGILTSLIVPACPSCALGILGLGGIGSVLVYLPFKGAEIGFLSVVILSTLLLYVLAKASKTSCTLSSNRRKKK